MNARRLEQQITFILEIDKLKKVLRQTVLTDGSRQENSVEHSWHIAIMALVLMEYAQGSPLDLLRVVSMLLIHDLVEIDAGDTCCYDGEGTKDQRDREIRAADRLFKLLPPDQAGQIRTLWDEFEEGTTPEARFAAALDRLQPLLHNYSTHGRMWQKHGIDKGQVVARNDTINEGAPDLWEFAAYLIEDAVGKGILAE